MEYLNYIFDKTFGGFDAEENLMINEFLSAKKQNEYFDSEILEVMICYYLENRKFKKADELLKKALKLYPNDEDICFLEILVLCEKSIEKALELTEKCLKKYSDRAFYLIKTIFLFDLKDFDNGEEAFYNTIEKIEEDTLKTELYYRTALYLCRADVFDYEEDEDADMKRTLLIKKFIDYAVLQEYWEDWLLYVAEQFFVCNYIKEAKLILNKAIDEDSYNLEAWRMLSEISVATGEYAEAANAFLYRITLNDKNNKLYFNCAICFQKARKYKEAIEYFDLQMDKYPDELDDIKFFCDILAAQGDCFMALEQFENAKNKFEDVLKINKKHFKALVLMAQCFYNQDDNEKALQLLNDALNIEPDFDNFDYENLYVVVGQIFEDIADNSKQRKHQKVHLINALISYRKSLIHLNLSRKIDKHYEDDLENKIALTLCQIGKINLLLGENMEALINLQLAFYFNEDIPMLNIFLVIVYANLGLFKDGLVHYQLIDAEELKNYEEIFPQLKYFREITRKISKI